MENRADSENEFPAVNGRLPTTDCSLPTARQTWAEVDLSALKHNYSMLCSLISASPTAGAAQSPAHYPRIIPVIKADAYGHGAIRTARALADAGAGMFAVGIVEEGTALRRAGISQDILVLGTVWLEQESQALEHQLILAVDSIESIERLDAVAGNMNVAAPVHIKVDTGMGRLGIRWDSMESLLESIQQSKHISLEGTFSHLSSADELDPGYTVEQKHRFEHALSEVRKAGLSPGEIHFANSAGLLYHESFRQWSSRIGIGLYGYAPDKNRSPLRLRPVLSLKTKVGPIRQIYPGESIGYNRRFTASRKTRFSTLPVGYADGLPRNLTGNCRVIIRNSWAEVIGAISMDMITVDLTDRPDVFEGDEVILLGAGSDCTATAHTWAEALETIPYEILCGIAARVPRTYI